MFDLKKLFAKKTIVSQTKREGPQFHMKPQVFGNGTRVRYSRSMYSAQSIRWVSTEQDENGEPAVTRVPVESSRKLRYPGRFTADGKIYQDWRQLCCKETNVSGVYTDVYGRSVFCYAERFPCFDSEDYLYENRFYRWFFILDEGKITRVFYTDGCNQIDVTEDVANIEYICWKDLNRLPFWNADVCKDKKQY